MNQFKEVEERLKAKQEEVDKLSGNKTELLAAQEEQIKEI